jgi:murein DD-endopeptidase MepM/ murein hydrolase activator NlpD
MRGIRLGVVAGLLAVLAPGPTPAVGEQRPLVAPPAYYRPVIVDGFTFPVARASWLSVIETGNDWHDPRFRLIDGRWRLVGFHEGNDIVAEEGTPVLAAAAGTVEAVGWTFYSGTRVGVRGEDGKYYFYAHLAQIAPRIVPGAPLRTGQVLGRVGNTGYGPPGREDRFPPHLHFGIEGPGGWENPYPLVRRMYRASIRTTIRAERRLAALAEAGDAEGFRALAAQVYAAPVEE